MKDVQLPKLLAVLAITLCFAQSYSSSTCKTTSCSSAEGLGQTNDSSGVDTDYIAMLQLGPPEISSQSESRHDASHAQLDSLQSGRDWASQTETEGKRMVASHGNLSKATVANGTRTSYPSFLNILRQMRGLDGRKKGGSENHQHAQEALLFLFGGLVLGCILLALHERFLDIVPYTVLLFIAGFFIATLSGMGESNPLVWWQTWLRSVDMWSAIDPHLLLHTLLPALIFSEAMCLQADLVERTVWQVLLLAGPGVIIGTGLTGLFGKFLLPYGWSWAFSMLVGSILSATDPVAVVSLFKTLGVSPELTMMISGESLINDGTAIVAFTLLLKVTLGEPLTAAGFVFFAIQMIVLPLVLGTFFGAITTWLVGLVASTHEHSDSMIQVIATICCAYLSFFIAENEFHTSGVLTVIFSGLHFAYRAWPRVICKETMHTVWEAIEFIGNTLIFLLAGVLFGRSVFKVNTSDFFVLILLYSGVMAIRGFMVFSFWVPLNKLGTPLSWRECVITTWSGLRGAVSLAMAIIASLTPGIDARNGNLVIFHVGGIAAITMLVNATTSAPLLKYLQLTPTSKLKDMMMTHLEFKISEQTLSSYNAAVGEVKNVTDKRFDGVCAEAVVAMVPSLKEEKTQPTFQLSNEETDGVTQDCREFFLRLVQRHYWEFVDNETLPKKTRVTNILLTSCDQALDEHCKCLDDWDFVVQSIEMAASSAFSTLHAIDEPHLLPLMLRNHLSTKTLVETWLAFAALTYMEAHSRAAKEIPFYFGEDVPHFYGERAKKQTVAGQRRRRCSVFGDESHVQRVIKESAMQCLKANQVLLSLDQRVVVFVKSRIFARLLLHQQEEQVDFLQEEGLVTPQEAHKIEHSILSAVRKLNEPNEEVDKALAKVAAGAYERQISSDSVSSGKTESEPASRDPSKASISSPARNLPIGLQRLITPEGDEDEA